MARPRRAWLHAVTGLLSALVTSPLPALAQAPGGAVPVTVAHARRQDVPVFIRGIGNVQAFRSVQLRARVDGTLDRIAFREGQEVSPGDLLAEIDPRPYEAALAQARAKREADAAQLQNAKRDLTRYAALVRNAVASQQQVDTQQATVSQAAATLQGDDASIEAAALNLSFCRITSPIKGVAGLRQVDEGNLIHANDTSYIVSIAQIHPISLVFTLSQDALPKIRAALQAGPAQVTALTSDGATVLSQGVLLTPDNTVDAQTGTIALKAQFDNADNKLWPGQFAAARLQLSVEKNALTVPIEAIQHGPDGLYVYAVQADDTVTHLPVKIGYETEKLAVVTDGLKDDQVVVVAGQSRLQGGTRVNPGA